MKKSFLRAAKKVFAVLLTVSLMSAALPVLVNGNQSEPKQKEGQGAENSWRYKNGTPIYPGQSFSRASKPYSNAWNKVNGMFVNDLGNPIPGAVKKGIDVSQHQGKIDWEMVKISGIDFAVIRCGYGMDQTDQDDDQWLRNVSECERLGIPYGVYLYSYADTVEKAKSEADHVIRLIKDKKLSYPVYYDLEDDSLLKLKGKRL